MYAWLFRIPVLLLTLETSFLFNFGAVDHHWRDTQASSKHQGTFLPPLCTCACHTSACRRACRCNYHREGKGDKEIRGGSWTLVSLAASTHGTLLKRLDRQCPLAACPHSNSWKGLRQKNNRLEESPSGLALVPGGLLTGALDVRLSCKTPASLCKAL